jgi:hypothetical protein
MFQRCPPLRSVFSHCEESVGGVGDNIAGTLDSPTAGVATQAVSFARFWTAGVATPGCLGSPMINIVGDP